MNLDLLKIFALERPSRRGLIELAVWTATYWLAFATPMALGETNGMGYFQQTSGHSLWLPLLLGGSVNIWLIYLHAHRAMPLLLVAGNRKLYAPALALIIVAYLLLHGVYQVALAHTVEPKLRSVSVAAWTVENLRALPPMLIASAIYKFGRDWILHMSNHLDLVKKTRKLEDDFHLVKEELSALKASASEHLALRFESGREKRQAPLNAIKYVKAAGNYVEIVCSNQVHTVYGSIADIMARLPEATFVRIHRSFIVNLDHITKMSADKAYLGDVALPIGATRKKELAERWRSEDA